MTGGDIYLLLLNLRNTPRPVPGSPAQRNLNRRTRTLLPTSESLLKSKVVDGEVVQHKLSESRQKSAVLANQHTKPLSTLQTGDTV